MNQEWAGEDAHEGRWQPGVEAGLHGGETILLVEDEAFVREVTCEVLRSAGYQVSTAATAREARREYERNGGVDCVITDVVLPGESGRKLAERLWEEAPQLKVLFVTGYAEQMDTRDCLAKPFSTTVLLRRVRMLLDGEGRKNPAVA